jgi:uncharacterized protein HemX
VHHQETNDTMPLILPQEKVLLYQNLHAQLDNVIWSLLYRQPIIYDTSINRLITWIQHYFDQSSSQTHSFLSALQYLKTQDIRPVVDNLDTTLQQFDLYFSSQNNLITSTLLDRKTAVLPIEPTNG